LTKLIITTLIVSPSGALSPGPLTIITIALGTKGNWKTGIKVALGHTLIEFPYIILLFFAFEYVYMLLRGTLGDILVVLVALIIAYFAILLIRDSVKGISLNDKNLNIIANPIIAGMSLTGLNVFFLLWWVSIGFELVRSATNFGIIGLIVMYISHVWIDFVWLALMAETGAKSLLILSSYRYRILLIVLSILLLIFGSNMVLERFFNLSILPI